ncbi:DNA-directed RNA polymerase subunit N [Candidatus Micrarchaeota archaeon]|nr:DNA-directed RNA polymerase subunit N [Candidatus Micrarchaeota archaeon]
MEFPVRCFTCGSVIGHRYEEYKEKAKNTSQKEALDSMNITRYCCRRMFLTHVELIDLVKKYGKI